MLSLDSSGQFENKNEMASINEAQPVVNSSSPDPSQPPSPIESDFEHLQMLETWLIIHPYKEQRRFMEEFPAILNPGSEDLIENTLMLESADVPGQIQELHDHLTLLVSHPLPVL